MTTTGSDTTSSQPVRIEVFRSGSFKPMVGDAITYSADDLSGIVAAYDPDTSPAPIVVGHPKTDTPAYGWVEGFEYDQDADRLYADVSLAGDFAETVKSGHFKNVSMSFFRPDAPNNPNPGSWYPKHVGFLGATAPAVSGLKPVSLAGPEGVTFVAAFSEAGFEDAASLFRGIRDFLIEKFSLEEADKVLPAYRLDWLAEADRATAPVAGNFSEPSPAPTQSTPITTKDVAMSDDYAKRMSELEKREADIAARETQARNADNAAFADTLADEGRLLPASRDQLVAVLNALPHEQDVSFAGDDGKDITTPLEDALKAVLKAQPVSVQFGAHDLGDDPASGLPASFASDGKDVDQDDLVIHEKATAHMSDNPQLSYLDAVKAVS